MNLDACLKAAIDGKAITKRMADDIRSDWERLQKHRKPGSGPLAGQEALDQLILDYRAAAANRKRNVTLQARTLLQTAADLKSHRGPDGQAALEQAAEAKLEHEGGFGFVSVAYLQKSLLGQAQAKMQSILIHFQRGKLLGDLDRHNKADLAKVVAELFGEDSGDAKAKALAKAWKDTGEWLRQRFNAAGGAIGKLENWGLPQHHDELALTRRGRDGWKADIKPMLDVTKMRHPLSGRAVTEDELDGVLDSVFDTVTTGGWIDRKVTSQKLGKGMVAGQHAEHRFLVFRDAASWLAYQKDYGGGDAFAAMMGHISMMTRDIAAMEVLGPNPEATITWLKNWISKEAALKRAGKPSLIAGSATTDHGRKLDTLWNSLRGQLNTPVNSAMGSFFAGARNFVTSVSLGGALLSSVSDIGTSRLARSFAGLSTSGTVTDIVRAFGTATRDEAIAAGLIFDSATHVFHQQARYVGTLNGPAWTGYLADRVLTLSGLTPWTQAGRHAFGLAFMKELADRTTKQFEVLPSALQATFTRHGLSARDWDKMRSVPTYLMHDGLSVMRPNEIDSRVDAKLASRYLAMIMAETEYAVPTGSHRARTWLINQNQSGTLIGEVIRSFAQFKSFGALFTLLHGKRMYHMALGGRKGDAAFYAAQLAITTFICGAVSVQLKDMAAGRKPRDMGSGAFIGAAALQGGGLGIWGDFLFSDINRYGGTMGGNIGGPLFEKASDFTNLTLGNLIQLGTGQKTNFGRELTRFISSNVPGNNVWYTRLLWERVLMENIQRVLDPEAGKAFRNRIRQRERDYGQGYWWAPGSTMPAF